MARMGIVDCDHCRPYLGGSFVATPYLVLNWCCMVPKSDINIPQGGVPHYGSIGLGCILAFVYSLWAPIPESRFLQPIQPGGLYWYVKLNRYMLLFYYVLPGKPHLLSSKYFTNFCNSEVGTLNIQRQNPARDPTSLSVPSNFANLSLLLTLTSL